MKLEGTYRFEAPRPVVYDMLQDPEVLKKIIPGCDQLDKTGENEYEAVLQISVGPVKGTFKGQVMISDMNPPESYRMEIKGQGAPGFVKGVGLVTLAEEGEATSMSYQGDAQVGGKIASVGQRLVDSAAKALIKQSLDGVNQTVQARVQARNQPDAPPPPEIKAPSQAEMAVEVAKEVAKDLVPVNSRNYAIGAVVGLVILIIVIRALSRKPKSDKTA